MAVQDDGLPLTLSPRVGSPRVETYAIADDTVVCALYGEHDLSSKGLLLETCLALGEEPKLIVDLTPCAFIDSTVISVLFTIARNEAQRVAVVAPDDGGHVHRALRIAGCAEFFAIRESLDDAQQYLSATNSPPGQNGRSAEQASGPAGAGSNGRELGRTGPP